MLKKKYKPLPKFRDEDEERQFWATHDSIDYVDWYKAEKAIFPNLQPTTKTISIRLPEHLLYRIKQLARSKDVPYQSLMKVFLSERVEKELHV